LSFDDAFSSAPKKINLNSINATATGKVLQGNGQNIFFTKFIQQFSHKVERLKLGDIIEIESLLI